MAGREPAHVGLIPDGLRRWAKRHGVPLADSYLRGAEKVIDILRALRRNDVRTVSVYNLSRANLARSDAELEPVYNASIHFLTALPSHFDPDVCSVRVHGDLEVLPEKYAAAARHTESVMRGDEFRINILSAYDADDELRAAHLRALREGGDIRKAYDIDNVDLVIRTSPEPLLSGFLPMQTQYAQLRFLTTPLNDLEDRQIDEFIDDFRRCPQRRGR
ncbi:di-trans,poly-cis-decaprenylcistransferase [Mycobacterium sp. E740]|nr:di-trans,poly-cis-decaprenylcistransferase [Mycobacterium sp. E740]